MTFAEVILWGKRVGVIAYDTDNGIGTFEYDPAFLASGIEISPIAMPLSRKTYTFPELSRATFHGLPGMLADSLPDKFGNAVIDAWLQSQGRTPDSFNPVERLCYTGNRGMGALEYVPMCGPSASESKNIEIEQLVQLASDILAARDSVHVSMGEQSLYDIVKVGTSAGGARAKAVIAWNESTGDIRSGQIAAGSGYGYWLLKFDGVCKNGDKEGADAPQYTRIEYAYYLMARNAGIEMSECRLLPEQGRYHFMTRRFDREVTTGKKLHMQSLGGLAHFDFNNPGAHSYEQAVQIMRRLGLSGSDILQLYRRMVFNVLARNYDDHVKNISFLMTRKGEWRLAPAYDVTYAYNPDGMWTGAHQMAINGKRRNISVNDLLETAKNMGIRESKAEESIAEIRQSMMCWSEYCEAAILSESVSKAIASKFIHL